MYGIARAESGDNRIKGPGVYDEAGVVNMGGRTPFRIHQMCEEMLGALDEMEVKIFKEIYI